MKYELLGETNKNYLTITQILNNRGITPSNAKHYLNTTDKDINDFRLLGEDKLLAAAKVLVQAVEQDRRVAVVVDVDNDGFCSSALLINYLYDLFPAWVKNRISWIMHDKKVHGLTDLLPKLLTQDYAVILVPDAGTNDIKEHKVLKKAGSQVICLDHHQQEYISEDAIIINNQCSDYPNKDFCGTGVVWQFCRYLDDLFHFNYSNNYLDLVALGLAGDMMSLLSFETKHLINKGIEEQNIHNPFFKCMREKNKFKLGDTLTGWGIVFYIVPFVNATVRSGTAQEKDIIFQSFLKFKAFEEIPSTKRGHQLGETEKLVEQAIRMCTNIKNRQGKAVDVGMKLLEDRIKNDNMMQNHKVLLFYNNGEIDSNIAGLCVNKISAKYQRPSCILKEHDGIYSGSARGAEMVGVTNFKQICSDTGMIDKALGQSMALKPFTTYRWGTL